MQELPTRRAVLATIGSGAVVLTGSGIATAHGGDGHDGGQKQQNDIAEVRRATAQYQDIDNARADGYVQASPCESNPNGDGAMGMHFVNPDLIDGSVEVTNPEALLYEPQGGEADPDLVGVEYVVPANAVSEAPSLFGEEFHGPHDVGAPWGPQYDLHVWCWRANPNGIFTPFNPNVECPD